MRAGTGLIGLVRWMASGVVAMPRRGGRPAAVAADGQRTRSGHRAPRRSRAIAAKPDDGRRQRQPTADDRPRPATRRADFLHSIEVYGFVDGYYGWAFNESNPQLRNFDVNHNNFSLNYVEFAIAKPATEKSRAGFRVDFGAGDTADLVNRSSRAAPEYLKYVQQAYVSYLAPVGKGA